MSAWQIVMTIVGAAYGSMLAVFVTVSIRDFRKGERDEVVVEFCPPGVNCQLCRQAEERRGVRPGGD
jgi:hypothetical protein